MIHKRPVRDTDDSFLFELYASTRLSELKAWGWEETMQQQFLQLQWMAQKHSYATQYPDAEHSVIIYQNTPIGRIMVSINDISITIVDITILSDYRNEGIGTRIIQDLQAKAFSLSRTILLSVLPNNPALLLYERLGFHPISRTGIHIRMKWTPTPSGVGPF